MIGTHGNFWGAIAPAARIEALLAAHVVKASIGKDVAKGYGTKWWDYRRMAPGHCFVLFIDRYYSGFRTAARTFLAHRNGRQVAGLSRPEAIVGVGQLQYKPEGIFERDRGHITGMWKAMQVADDFGMPYDHFCRLAFEAAMDRKWQRLPHPRQLYSPEIGARAVDAWETLLKNRLITATHPMFHVENYAGMQVQDDYRGWLVERLKERSDPATSIYNLCFHKPQLPIELVEPLFPAATINRAKLLAA